MTLKLRIEGKRASLTGKLDRRLLQLSAQLEGMKKWLKAGGFSFEVTPMNMERFRALFPDAEIEDTNPPPSSRFEALAETVARPVRGAYQPRTQPFPFQGVALASAGHGGRSSAPAQPAAAARPLSPGPPLILPVLGHGRPPPELLPMPVQAPVPGPSPAALGWVAGQPAPAFALFGEMGTGKSKILIDMAGELWCAGLIDAVLIVSPKGVHEQWITEQIPAHMGEAVPWQGIAIDGAKKLPRWDPAKLAILSVNVDHPRTKRGLENCFAFIDHFLGRVLMIVDESHKIKNPASTRTEAIIALGKACAFRRIATGTPISRDLSDAFAQYYFLDNRILGQEYVTSFKAEYCITGGDEWESVVGHKNVEQFYARIAPFTFRITKEEADLGLPAKQYARHPFELTPEQKAHYAAMKEDMITRMDSGELVAVANVVAQLTRLQQIACGYLVSPADKEKGIPQKVEFLKNARMDALKEVLAAREGKAVIWCRYNHDVATIAKELGSEAVTYAGITPENMLERNRLSYLNPNGARYFVGNPAKGGTGLNLQGETRTVIYYSNSFNAIERWQSEDRPHRIGMIHAITYIDMIARATIDLKILNNLRDKKTISDLAFDDIRRMLED